LKDISIFSICILNKLIKSLSPNFYSLFYLYLEKFIMPRFCVICGKVQSHSFSVFSFPTSQKKRNAWLDVILKVKPDFLNDKRVVDNKQLKNGVCELHFFQSEISNGKKRRLEKDAVPTLDIPASGKCFSTLRKYKTFLINESEDFPSLSALPYNSDNETIRSQISLVESKHKFSNDIVSLPDCTIEIEDKNSSPKIYKRDRTSAYEY
ncbi:hypothetical protein Anas_03902, partial [Armadillidium nasatum]